MKPLITLTALTWLPCLAHAAATVSYTYSVNTSIPDNSGIGLSNTQSISTPYAPIGEVNVQLTLRGGWNGDMYAYLAHGDGFAVLLNRPGRYLNGLYGSGSSGLSVLFADTALTDIHTAIPNSGVVAGFFQPDARAIDPDNALDSSARSAFLSSFNGQDANGDWTLYVADVASGDTAILESWTLTVTTVPEPSSVTLVALGMLALLRRKREQPPTLA